MIKRFAFGALAAGLIALAPLGSALADFVGDLSGLSEVDEGNFDEVYARGGALPSGYASVYVAPVGVIEGQDESLDDLGANDRQDMQDYLHKRLELSLGESFALVDAPAAGVLVVQASFTALKPNKPTMDQLSEEPGLDYSRSFGVGHAGVQIELRDGATGELLAAFIDQDEGQSLDTNTNIHQLWGDAEEFSRRWASDLAKRLGG